MSPGIGLLLDENEIVNSVAISQEVQNGQEP